MFLKFLISDVLVFYLLGISSIMVLYIRETVIFKCSKAHLIQMGIIETNYGDSIRPSQNCGVYSGFLFVFKFYYDFFCLCIRFYLLI